MRACDDAPSHRFVRWRGAPRKNCREKIAGCAVMSHSNTYLTLQCVSDFLRLEAVGWVARPIYLGFLFYYVNYYIFFVVFFVYFYFLKMIFSKLIFLNLNGFKNQIKN
jgi:hypothetical protein